MQSRAVTRAARWGLALFFVFVLAGGAYFARDRFSGSSQSLAVASPAPHTGGSFAEGDIGVPVTFNPLLASSQTERDLAALIFNGLAKTDGSGLPQPDLAQGWSISDDGLTYTVVLRSGVTWQDGQPFTSQDVRFTIGLIQSADFSGDAALAHFWRAIVVDTPDDATVVFHLLDPFAPFLNYLTLPIVPKHVLAGVLAQDLTTNRFSQNPLGTGPFRFASYDPVGRVVRLEAFGGYFGPKPHLNRVSIQYFDDDQGLFAALRRGEVQGTGTLAPEQLLRSGSLPKNDLVYAPLVMSYTALFFNTRDPLFASGDVRQALQLAIDPAELLDGELGSAAVPGSGPIPRSSWAYAAQPVATDPERAASMLEQAGWKYVSQDGVLENGGVSLSFPLLVNADDPQRVAVAQAIAEALGRINVRVQVQPVASDEVNAALSNQTFSAALFGWHFSTGDPDCYNLWHSTASSAGMNVTGISDEAIDRALMDARTTTDIEKRKALYAQFQESFVRQAPAVILYYPRFLYVVSAEFHGISAEPIVDPSDRFRRIASWYQIGSEDATPTP